MDRIQVELEGIVGDWLEVSDKKLFKLTQGFLKDLTCRMPLALLKECRLALLVLADTLIRC